jgi:hypothetical protein
VSVGGKGVGVAVGGREVSVAVGSIGMSVAVGGTGVSVAVGRKTVSLAITGTGVGGAVGIPHPAKSETIVTRRIAHVERRSVMSHASYCFSQCAKACLPGNVYYALA